MFFRKNKFLVLAILCLILYVSSRAIFSLKDTSEIIQQIQTNIDNISNFADDILLLHKRKIESGNLSFESLLALNPKFPVFVFKNEELLYWSGNLYGLDTKLLINFYKEKTFKINDGSIFYAKKLSAKDGYEYVIVIPLYIHFRLENRILTSAVHEDIFPTQNLKIYLPAQKDNKILNRSRNLELFSVEAESNIVYNDYQRALFLLIFTMGLAFLLWQIKIWVDNLVLHRKAYLALGLLIFSLVLIRFIMLQFKMPSILYQTPLMMPRIYASSCINPSLGDLLINTFCTLAILIFIFNHNTKLIPYKLFFKSKFIYLIIGFFSLLPALSAIWTKVNLASIFYDSQLNLNISEEISFSPAKILSFTFLVFCLIIYFLLGNIAIRFIERTHINNRNRLVIILISHLILAAATGFSEWELSILSALYVIFSLFMGYAFSLRDYEKGAFSYFVTTVLVFAILTTAFIGEFAQKKQQNFREKVASWLALDNDFKAEWYLNRIRREVAGDTSLFLLVKDDSNFKKQIIEKLPAYFSSYEISINLYSDTTFENIWQELEPLVVATGFEGVYLFNDIMPLDHRYLTILNIKSDKPAVALLDIRRKTPMPNSIIGHLTANLDIQHHTPGLELSFAHIRWGSIISSKGSFLYDKSFLMDYERAIANENQSFTSLNFNHFAEPDGEGGHFVVSLPVFSWGDYFSNFSFIFLFLILNMLVISFILAFIYRDRELKLSFASKIQFYLNSAFFVPFLIVSIVIVSILNYTNQQESQLFYLDKAENVSQRILEKINHSKKIEKDTLQDLLNSVSNVLQADIHLYDKKGILLASSQDYVFRNGLISNRINPFAYSQLLEKRLQHWLNTEYVAKFQYSNVYYTLKSPHSGELLGFLSLPFKGTKSSFDKLIVDVLNTIAKIFTIIFLLLFLVLRVSTRALIWPLRVLREKLRSTSLTSENIPIDYQNKDEIGLLVNAYNSMIVQLEESKRALARSEKESAWREMAKQVAHEIKNPLTPMKLTLQHLQRTVQEASVLRSIRSLLGQVEALADIATSFASYAKMPLPVEEELDIAQVLMQTIALHQADCDILVDIPKEEFPVMGDKNMLGRIFSNLILNGIQAAQGIRAPKIMIRMYKRETRVIIEFHDNGIGISEDIQSKIFVPDFTTKSTGSGIGLALSKRGIEHLGGSIWFETQYGEGTVFYVDMPLLKTKIKETRTQTKKISL